MKRGLPRMKGDGAGRARPAEAGKVAPPGRGGRLAAPARVSACAVALAVLAVTSCSRPVPVGVVLSQSGAAAYYGEKVRKGLDLALAEERAKQGFGRRVRLVYEDDATNPEVGEQVARELIEKEGVRVIIGAVSSAVTLRIAPLCEKSRTVLLSPTCSAPAISQAGEYIFRNYPSDVLEGTGMADFARDLGLRDVVVLAVDDEFGRGLERVFRDRFAAGSGRAVRSYFFGEGRTETFKRIVAEIEPRRPDGIYVVGYVPDVAAAITAVRSTGIDSVILGASSVTADVVRLAGSAAENLVFPGASFDPESVEPPVRAFVQGYRARYGEDPDSFAAHAYDALKLVVLAMDRAGSADPDAVRKALLNIDDFGGASGPTAFDGNGDVVQYPRLFVVRHGRAVPYDRFVEQGGSLLAPAGS